MLSKTAQIHTRETQTRKALQTVSLLWASTGIGAAAAFILQVHLARTLGVAEYGVLATAIFGIAIFVPLAAFGVPQLWLQTYGAEGKAAKRWMPGTFRVLLVASALAGAGVLSWLVLAHHGAESAWLLLLLLPHVFGQSANELVGSKYQIEGRYTRLSLLQLSPHLARLALAMGVGTLTANVIAAGAVYAAVGTAMLLLAWTPLRAMWRGQAEPLNRTDEISRPSARDQNPSCLTCISRAWPFGLAGIFHLIYFQSNIVIVNAMAGQSDAGLYAVAFGVLSAMYLIPTVLYQKYLLPKLHYWGVHDRRTFSRIFKAGSAAMLLVGSLVGAGLYVTSPILIRLVFGTEYLGVTNILRVMALSVPFMFMSHSSGAVLVSGTSVRIKTLLMGLVAAINVVVCMFLVARIGAVGAAYAGLLSNALLFASYTAVAIYALRFTNNVHKN